jgi:hypothetical protein
VLRSDFFIKAMRAGRYSSLAWCVSAFAITQPIAKEEWLKKAKDFDIYRDTSGIYSYVGGEFERFEGASVAEPLFLLDEYLVVKQGDIPNLKENELISTYGNLLMNWIILVYPFGDKLPYTNSSFTKTKHTSFIVANLVNDQEGVPRDPTKIYMDEYYRYAKAHDYIRGFTQLSVYSFTKKSTLPPPGLAERKKQLFEQNAGQEDDLAVLAKIADELGKFDDEYLKGDKCEKFLASKKSRRVVRAKKFLMVGADTGFEENAVKGVPIKNSLYEGWDITHFAAMNDTLRAGSFNRGAQTALGGVSVKWLLRAASNLTITVDDCGSTSGSLLPIYPHTHALLIGMTLIDDQGNTIKVQSEEESGQYIGKVVRQRSATHCKLGFTDYCKTCLGDRLSINPNGLPLAVSGYGSGFMGMFMAAMHGKQLATARLDWKNTIS